MSKNLALDTIRLGDSVDIMNSLPAESVDLVFADPPYNLQLKKELRRPNNSKVRGVDHEWDRFDDFAAYDKFSTDWLKASRRVLKKTGALWVIGSYHNIHRLGTLLQNLNFWILNSVVWVKSNPTPNFRGVRFTNAHETLLWAQKEQGQPYTFNYHAMKDLNGEKQMRSDWNLPIATGQERLRANGKALHPTQKPEALLYRVLQSSTDPGDVVLDPFFGTGTTGVVAKRLHRRWIGIEQDPDYVELARTRIEKVQQDPFEAEHYSSYEPRKEARVPFGRLLEENMLKIGQKLFWGEKGRKSALVLADGALKYNGRRGSIHQLAKHIHQAPANGWQHWFFEDPKSGKRHVIDELRQKIRKQMESK
jgi:DNA modification methylase